jgi:type IV secretory pathway protease TraF
MQCVSCQFENMPGVAACGRCGARLALADAAIDVHPPRTRPGVKRLRRWFPWHGLAARFRDGVEAIARITLRQLNLPHLLPSLFIRMVVPGWPQIFTGRVALGRTFLGVYLGLLLVGILFVGTPLGSVALGLAISVHASSVIDVLWSATADWRTRVTYAAICMAVLGAVVYLPVAWIVTRFVVPRQLVWDVPPFAVGDAVLYNPSAYRWSAPTPGDVVLFRILPQQVQTRTPQGYNAVYRLDGEFIDRVLAGPGQGVRWDGKSLWVDGQPSLWRPLNPTGVTVSLQCAVPARCYLVFPSALPLNAASYPPDVWMRMSLVPRENLLGRVFLRHQPLARWWWIR